MHVHDTTQLAYNVHGKGIDEPGDWEHREIDGQARKGSERDERERTSQILKRYDATLIQKQTFFYQQDHGNQLGWQRWTKMGSVLTTDTNTQTAVKAG
jgi:hypothetical protein